MNLASNSAGFEDLEMLDLLSGVGFAFTRVSDGEFDPARDAVAQLLVANSESPTLGYHTGRNGVAIDLSGASAGVAV